MADTLVLVHTVFPLVDVFNGLARELLPGVPLMHILDEPLLEMARRQGHSDREISDRLLSHVTSAERIGARIVLVTCSTLSPVVDDVLPSAGIPVMKIDEALIAQAVARGQKIGVVATSASTLEPTRHLLESRAAASNRHVDIEQVLVEDALPSLLNGDGPTHDRLVRESVTELAERTGVVVLAQASMARVLAGIPEDERRVPILSSPHLALGEIRKILNKETVR